MDPTTGHQVLNYLPRLLALSAARAKLGIESLWFTTANVLAEGCFSNVFIVKDEKVMTPALDTPVVPGIVRKHVCKLAAGQGLEVIEGELLISDLLGAQEVFLTSTVMGVLPVVKIEAHTVGAGKPAPVTKKLSQSFDEYFDKSCKRQNLQ
jgi:branched-chain amino acid aminotransferase